MRPFATANPTALTDRAPERQPVADALHKPAIFGRSQQTWLCLAALGVILYGTLGPVTSAARPWIDPLASWSWRVPLDDTNANDIITNVVVYVPVGIALRLLIRRRGRAGWPDFIVALASALALSYLTELLQQFMPLRSANLLDVLTNAIGAVLGCAVAVPAQHRLRRVHAAAFECMHLRRDAWSVILWAAVFAALVVLTMPWTLKRPSFTWGLDQPLSVADPQATGRFIMFAAVGLLGAGRALLLGLAPRVALTGTIWRVTLFAEAVELAQSVLGEHVSCQLHVLIAGLGATAGAAIAVCAVDDAAPAHGSHATRRKLRSFALLALALVIGVSLLADLGVAPGSFTLRPAADFRWVPFRSHFHVAFTTALADVAQIYLKYAVLALVALAHTHGRKPAASLLLVLAVAGLVEFARTFLVGRPGDSTTLVIAVVAWLTVRRAWSALYPARAAALPA